MNLNDSLNSVVPELLVSALIWLLYPPLLIYLMITHIIDYRLLKNYYMKKQQWDLNVSCGNTDGGGINADIIKRNVPNFVLIKDICDLPFKDKQFENTICSHTIEHIEKPEKLYKELRRVSENVVLFVPPVWDLAALMTFREHKWQFLTLKTRHVNSLPRRFKLPYWWLQRRFGQKIAC